MTADTVFQVASTVVLIPWALLILAPRWKWTQTIAAIAVPFLLSLVYILIFLREFLTPASGGFNLDLVQRLFAKPWVALGGWIHYLAFDLFIGAWETRDAEKLGIAHARIVPFLLLTFMFGPMGLFAYLILRLTMKKQVEP